MDFGNDIDAIDQNLLTGRRTQGRMQRRAFFRGVDSIAAKHCGRAFAQTALRCQRDQQLERFADDAVF